MLTKYRVNLVAEDTYDSIFITTVMAEDETKAYLMAVEETETKGISLPEIFYSVIGKLNHGIVEVRRREPRKKTPPLPHPRPYMNVNVRINKHTGEVTSTHKIIEP